MEPAYQAEKFRELVLYVAERSLDDPKFGKTKLAKLLFYSDFFAHGYLGSSITGAQYGKWPRGPFPRPLDRELKSLEKDEAAFVATSRYHEFDQFRVVARRQADLSLFTAEEIALVDEVLRSLEDKDAATVSRLSHLEAGWECVEDYATIPYDMVFVSNSPLSPETVEAGREIAEKHGLLTL
jgi:Protein of unknown function (DUF4065)